MVFTEFFHKTSKIDKMCMLGIRICHTLAKFLLRHSQIRTSVLVRNQKYADVLTVIYFNPKKNVGGSGYDKQSN